MATKKQVVVIAQDPEDPDNSPDVFTTYKKSIMGMSIAMIVLGVLSVVLELVLYYWYAVSGYGLTALLRLRLSVITGLVDIATGGLGVYSAQKPHRITIQALMALTIISACLNVSTLVLDGFSMVFFSWGPHTRVGSVSLTLSVVLDILGLAGGIISTILSACTCSAICSPRTEAGTVRYTRAAVSDGRQ